MGQGTWDNPYSGLLFIMPPLLLLSYHLREGDGEFSILGPPLFQFLAKASMDKGHGTTLPKYLIDRSLNAPLLNPSLTKHPIKSNTYKHMSFICLNDLNSHLLSLIQFLQLIFLSR
jgi:hypothetical protein